jgi:hypothetical protein
MGVNVVNTFLRAHLNSGLSSPEWDMREHLGAQTIDNTSPLFTQGDYETLRGSAQSSGQTQAGFDQVASGIGGGGQGSFGYWYAGRPSAWKTEAFAIFQVV